MTNCWRLSRNHFTHLRAGHRIPQSCSLRASFSWLHDFIKGLAEVKQSVISLFFLIDGFAKIIAHHQELGFTRALLSEAMLKLIEDIYLDRCFYGGCNYVFQCFTKNTSKGYGPVVGRVRALTCICLHQCLHVTKGGDFRLKTDQNCSLRIVADSFDIKWCIGMLNSSSYDKYTGS